MEIKEPNIYAVSDLTNIIKTLIKKKLRVTGEVSQPKLSGGHLYFTLKDNISNMKAIIWKSSKISKEEIIEGQKITIDCYLDYYGGTGSISLIVDKLIVNDGFGELFLKYEKIKNDFMSKGYFDYNRKKKLPDILNNILIITSANGAALQDFLYNLSNNKSLIKYDIADVVVQGNDCPKNICELLNKSKDMNYDLVVITRGGGSFSDLFGFSQPELIEAIYNFHLPVLSAIGHQVDNPLIDLVADYSAPTPSLASQLIVDHNKKYLMDLNLAKKDLRLSLLESINNESKYLQLLDTKLTKKLNFLKDIKQEYKSKLLGVLQNRYKSLCDLEMKRYKLYLNENNMVLYNGKTKINNSNELDNNKNNVLQLVWGGKSYYIKIIV